MPSSAAVSLRCPRRSPETGEPARATHRNRRRGPSPPTGAGRALVGVDEASGELPDQLVVDWEIEDALRLELGTWLPATLSSILAGGDGTSSPADLTYLALRNAGRAWCAWQVLQVGEISIAQKHEAGPVSYTHLTLPTTDLV